MKDENIVTHVQNTKTRTPPNGDYEKGGLRKRVEEEYICSKREVEKRHCHLWRYLLSQGSNIERERS